MTDLVDIFRLEKYRIPMTIEFKRKYKEKRVMSELEKKWENVLSVAKFRGYYNNKILYCCPTCAKMFKTEKQLEKHLIGK